MANYRIEIGRSAEKALAGLPKADLVRVLEHIKALGNNPYPPGCRKLAGEEDVYRIRSGRYRIIYEVLAKIILVRVLKIGHRKDVYR